MKEVFNDANEPAGYPVYITIGGRKYTCSSMIFNVFVNAFSNCLAIICIFTTLKISTKILSRFVTVYPKWNTWFPIIMTICIYLGANAPAILYTNRSVTGYSDYTSIMEQAKQIFLSLYIFAINPLVALYLAHYVYSLYLVSSKFESFLIRGFANVMCFYALYSEFMCIKNSDTYFKINESSESAIIDINTNKLKLRATASGMLMLLGKTSYAVMLSLMFVYIISSDVLNELSRLYDILESTFYIFIESRSGNKV
ncbi:hypothetical protein NEMIN01_1576 [Nematocida minor]|uniref:uncharacterized protein n=1 Tax=Nematocida minor TaxID=1912983 RepID=UPI0022205B81|nr:uncharacterized protein NEMIN01_1576 [Nematocida minor]KAI5191592.1 hypothetical protein NEMIN01_1576 [Nematocida minor]